MQALSMIDTSMKIKEAVVPARSAEPKGKKFGAVIKQRHQAEATPKEQPQGMQRQEASQEKTAAVEEVKQPEKQAVDSTTSAPRIEGFVEAEVELNPQQAGVQFMKMSGSAETALSAEELVPVADLLNRLNQHLEGADLDDEQALAGVDLVALVEQLQKIADEDGENPLAQLAEQLGIQLDQQQLSDDQTLRIDSDLAGATLLNNDPQVMVPKMMESLAQVRQLLQQAVTAAETTAQTGVSEAASIESTETQEEGLWLSGKAGAQIDQRFAGLLNPRTEEPQAQMGLRQQLQNAAGNQKAAATPADQSDMIQPLAEVVSEKPEGANFAELANHGSRGIEKLVQQDQVQPGFAQGQNHAVKVAPQAQVVQLPSGQQVAESQIFDQVVTHISGSHNGESGRMVLRLQPAELGSLKLELMVEGDRIKANLHAQTTQVQEVLERHLPQLRNALAEQGLKIDQFQVNVDQRQQNGQFENLAQQGQNRDSNRQNDWTEELELEEQSIPLAHLMQNGGGGISLHV